ncbi:MAG TPA: DUF211 domain-containing protein [bacterium]|nr:DUF211 domain-containing protein [bacterium]
MAAIRRIVLDTLKPHEPGIIELAEKISDQPGVDAVNISIYEMDRKVENAKITIEGNNIQVDEVFKIVKDYGASIHSIDEVVAGKKIIDDSETPQDSYN